MVSEHKFHSIRRWRFDFALPDARIGIEVEGGVFSRGRHVRPAGFIADCEKYNVATASGWRVLRFVPSDKNPEWVADAVGLIEDAIWWTEEDK